MDDLIEIILELIFEGSIELVQNKKVPKWIRIIISLIPMSIIFGIIVLGIVILKKSILGGTILLVVAIILLVGIIIKIRKYMRD